MQLDIRENKRKLKNTISNCVYFLYKDDKIVYIGSTSKCLSTRISSHLKSDKEFNEYSYILKEDFNNQLGYLGSVSIEYMTLHDIESYYIFKCKPMYNLMLPKNSIYISFKKAKELFSLNMLAIKKIIRLNELDVFLNHFNIDDFEDCYSKQLK